jgi:hypothetical protein
MFFRHSLDKLIYPVIAGAIIVLVSYRSSYRLRADMPQTFYESKVPCGPNRPLDQRIACAYWDNAQMNVQWKYPHGTLLPVNVPPEFVVDAPALGPEASSQPTRQLYWHRLQQVWNIPETWTQTYEWNWGWAKDPLNSAGEWLRDTAGKL